MALNFILVLRHIRITWLIDWPIFGHSLLIDWPIFGHSLLIDWPIFGHSLLIDWPIFGHSLLIDWPIFDYSLLIDWPIFGYSLLIDWPIFGQSLLTPCSLMRNVRNYCHVQCSHRQMYLHFLSSYWHRRKRDKQHTVLRVFKKKRKNRNGQTARSPPKHGTEHRKHLK